MQTYYRWRKKFGGLMPSEMKHLKQLEEENQRRKRLVADLGPDKEMQGSSAKRTLGPARRRKLVDETTQLWQAIIWGSVLGSMTEFRHPSASRNSPRWTTY